MESFEASNYGLEIAAMLRRNAGWFAPNENLLQGPAVRALGTHEHLLLQDRWNGLWRAREGYGRPTQEMLFIDDLARGLYPDYDIPFVGLPGVYPGYCVDDEGLFLQLPRIPRPEVRRIRSNLQRHLEEHFSWYAGNVEAMDRSPFGVTAKLLPTSLLAFAQEASGVPIDYPGWEGTDEELWYWELDVFGGMLALHGFLCNEEIGLASALDATSIAHRYLLCRIAEHPALYEEASVVNADDGEMAIAVRMSDSAMVQDTLFRGYGLESLMLSAENSPTEVFESVSGLGPSGFPMLDDTPLDGKYFPSKN